MTVALDLRISEGKMFCGQLRAGSRYIDEVVVDDVGPSVLVLYLRTLAFSNCLPAEFYVTQYYEL